jgi:uncharacterized protein (TIGR02145 family)
MIKSATIHKMRKKTNFTIIPLIIMGVFLGYASSCEKNDDNINPTNGRTTALFNPNVTYGEMTDQDGNVYKTVTIGTQTWMAENLRTTKYNDGTAIPEVTVNNEWAALTRGAYCNYMNTNDIDTIATYGRLYNWHAVNTGKLAPNGWHVPTYVEWKTLTTYLGGDSVSGGKLKETGTTHWISPNKSAINETGFTALPGGNRDYDGTFDYVRDYGVREYGFWWSATKWDASGAWNRSMSYGSSYVFIYAKKNEAGYSVRCVRD